MNLETLIGRTREELGVRHAADELLDDEITSVLNEVYDEVLDLEDWSFLKREITFSTVVDQSVYDATDLGEALPERIDLVYVDDTDQRRPLRPMRDADRVVHLTGLAATGSSPQVYELDRVYDASDDTYDARIELHPTPDAVETIVIRGKGVQADLSASTDEPLFAARFHSVLHHLAAAYLLGQRAGEWLDKNGDVLPDAALERRISLLGARAQSRLADMFTFYNVDHDDGLIRMGSRRDAARRRSVWL